VADNVEYTPGTGATIAADEVGGVLHQRVKITHGADGVADDATEDSPLPVHDHEGGEILRRMAAIVGNPPGFDRALNRQRNTAVIESGTVTTVSTVTSVNNLNFLGALPAQALVVHQTNAAWAQLVRARIS
jgi:hypothetical protein